MYLTKCKILACRAKTENKNGTAIKNIYKKYSSLGIILLNP